MVSTVNPIGQGLIGIYIAPLIKHKKIIENHPFYRALSPVKDVAKNKAVYTAISVACGWAGAVMSLCKPRNSEIRDRKLDDTDGPTNRPTDRHSVL